jgi:uncharacterized membrane protein
MADVTACNESAYTMRIAVAHVPKDAPGISTSGGLATTVEGWWTLPRGGCKQVLSKDAGAHWVSFYAESKPAGRVMSGKEPRFCVSEQSFEERQRTGSPCRSGWRPVGFQRSETGKRNHTFTVR